MLKIKIFFVMSVAFVLFAFGLCGVNFLGVKKFFIVSAVFSVFIVSLSVLICLFMLMKKFGELNKKVNFVKGYSLENVAEKLNEFTDICDETFDINDLELNPQNLVKEIDELIDDMKKDELDKVEVLPIQNQKNNINKQQYIQKEKRYSKPEIPYKEPIVLSSEKIGHNKGFYLVDCEGKKAVVGYVGDEVVLINSSDNLNTPSLKVKLTEKFANKDIYMVKSGKYKALVQVENEKMKVLLEM